MTSRDFCFWLQGFFEISELQKHEQQPVTLSNNQVQAIKAHLNLVFYHEIDPSFSTNSLEQKKMQKLHDEYKKHQVDPHEEKMRC